MMEIRLLTPVVLRKYASNDLRITMDGNSVGHLLDAVQQLHPALHGCICDETGQVRQHIHLFLGNEMIPRCGRQTPLQPGDVVSVFQAVSGG